MSADKPKRVFVSHSSEDKLQFAKPLADQLIANGIEAWLDVYELSGGDDLVEGIWEKGLTETDCVVLLLSPSFLQKKWTMAEFRTAVAKKVEQGVRVIPVVVTPCAIPEALLSTVRFEVTPDRDIHQIALSIIDIIHGTITKPKLGEPPLYTSPSRLKIAGLTVQDTRLLELIYEIEMQGSSRTSWEGWWTSDHVLTQAEALGITREVYYESIYTLMKAGWLKSIDENHPAPYMGFRLEPHAVISISASNGIDVDQVQCRIASLILNDGIGDVYAIADKMEDCHFTLIICILLQWSEDGWLGLSLYLGAKNPEVYNPSIELKRWFRTTC